MWWWNSSTCTCLWICWSCFTFIFDDYYFNSTTSTTTVCCSCCLSRCLPPEQTADWSKWIAASQSILKGGEGTYRWQVNLEHLQPSPKPYLAVWLQQQLANTTGQDCLGWHGASRLCGSLGRCQLVPHAELVGTLSFLGQCGAEMVRIDWSACDKTFRKWIVY